MKRQRESSRTPGVSQGNLGLSFLSYSFDSFDSFDKKIKSYIHPTSHFLQLPLQQKEELIKYVDKAKTCD